MEGVKDPKYVSKREVIPVGGVVRFRIEGLNKKKVINSGRLYHI